MTDRQALLSAAGKQRPYKAVNIKPPAMPGDIYLYCFLGAVYRVFIFGAYTQRKMRTAVSVGMACTLHRERGFLQRDKCEMNTTKGPRQMPGPL